MTGNQVREVRKGLGWTHERLSGLLGVHVSSVLRWQAEGDDHAAITGIPLRLLNVLWFNRTRDLGSIGDSVAWTMDSKSVLAAIRELIEWAADV